MSWSLKEVEYLVAAKAAKIPVKKIASVLGKTTAATNGKIHSMGLANQIKQWSQEDDDYLTEAWAKGQPNHMIGTVLGEKPAAIGVRAKQLGLPNKQNIINEFLHNSEIQEYYDLLGNTKKFDLKKK